MLELKQLILTEEVRFKFVFILEPHALTLLRLPSFSSVAAEIEAIRAGKWDLKIAKDLGVDDTTLDRSSQSPSPSPQSEVCPFISSTSQELSFWICRGSA